jgi:capsid assembly protein
LSVTRATASTDGVASAGEQGKPAASAAAPAAGDRPAWLPEKFKTPEDMANSYKELETKLGQSGKPADTAAPASGKIEQPAAGDKTVEGVDFTQASKEYAEKGELSESTRKSLHAKGINDATINSFIEGQKALAAQVATSMAEAVGGPAAMKAVLDWAGTNLSRAEIDAYNSVVDSGNAAAARLALQGIASKYTGATGQDPALLKGGEGGGTQSAVLPFKSEGEVVAAMRDPRYRNDSAYRKEVEQRLGKTELFNTRSV